MACSRPKDLGRTAGHTAHDAMFQAPEPQSFPGRPGAVRSAPKPTSTMGPYCTMGEPETASTPPGNPRRNREAGAGHRHASSRAVPAGRSPCGQAPCSPTRPGVPDFTEVIRHRCRPGSFASGGRLDRRGSRPRLSDDRFPGAPVAQLDRASASGAEGRQFESARACHLSLILPWPPSPAVRAGFRLPVHACNRLAGVLRGDAEARPACRVHRTSPPRATETACPQSRSSDRLPSGSLVQRRTAWPTGNRPPSRCVAGRSCRPRLGTATVRSGQGS